MFAFGCAPYAGPSGRGAPDSVDRLDVPYEPTHPEVVDLMLREARVKPGDVLFELGCGDGRIAIAAVRTFGARAVCVDIEPERIREAKEKARHYGVDDRIEFVVGNIFETDVRRATVVAIYLTTRVNRWLRPKLLDQLSPGSRVVSHAFGMSEWKADREFEHPRARHRRVFLYVVPARVAGRYTFIYERSGERLEGELVLEQEFQTFTGRTVEGGQEARVERGRLRGGDFEFEWVPASGRVRVRGRAGADLVGSCSPPASRCSFRATRIR